MWWHFFFVLLSESNFVRHYVNFLDFFFFYNSCRDFPLSRAASSLAPFPRAEALSHFSSAVLNTSMGALFWQSAVFCRWEVRVKLREVWKRLLKWPNFWRSSWKLQVGWCDAQPIFSFHPDMDKEGILNQEFSMFSFGLSQSLICRF